MRTGTGESSTLFVDACCWIDLFATGSIEEILPALGYRSAVSQYVVDNELISIRAEGGLEESCELRQIIQAGRVDLMSLQSEPELAWLVAFAAHLDDGEASICALAKVHGGAVATNDRKAIHTLRRLAPEIPIFQTPELLFRWARGARRTAAEVKVALERVRDRARFVPRHDCPQADWWFQHLGPPRSELS